MIIFPYKAGKLYDDGLRFVVQNIRQSVVEKDDDALILCCGTTGTGKTSLMFHAYEEYDAEGATIDQVALTRKDFAGALKTAKDAPGLRFAGYDESNVNKRDSTTRFNKVVIDLYFSIRGLRIFHWWNNPSVDYIDKVFIEERLKGVIFIFTKDKKRPRLYYYFRKRDILALYERVGDLKLRTLKKHARRYAYYRGWFLPYNGRLWAEYLKKKDERMAEKVEEFFAEYGGELVARPELQKELGVSRSTINEWESRARAEGVLGPEHIKINGAGRVFYTQEGRRALIDFKDSLKRLKTKVRGEGVRNGRLGRASSSISNAGVEG